MGYFKSTLIPGRFLEKSLSHHQTGHLRQVPTERITAGGVGGRLAEHYMGLH